MRALARRLGSRKSCSHLAQVRDHALAWERSTRAALGTACRASPSGPSPSGAGSKGGASESCKVSEVVETIKGASALVITKDARSHGDANYTCNCTCNTWTQRAHGPLYVLMGLYQASAAKRGPGLATPPIFFARSLPSLAAHVSPKRAYFLLTKDRKKKRALCFFEKTKGEPQYDSV